MKMAADAFEKEEVKQDKLIKYEQNDQYIDDNKQFYQNLKDDLSMTKLESEINFNRRECEASLLIDLEYGRC